eukprot:jgi/Mesen1/10767/ME000091S10312
MRKEFRDMAERSPFGSSEYADASEAPGLPALSKVVQCLLAADSRALEKALKRDRYHQSPAVVERACLSLVQHVKGLLLHEGSLEPVCAPLLQH